MNETITFGFHDYDFTEEYGVNVRVERFVEQRGEWHAYLQINADPVVHPSLESPHVIFTKHNLSSSTARRGLCRTLETRIDLNGDWESVMELVCTRSLRHRWEGAPLEKIGQIPKRIDSPYLLYPIIREGAPTVLYGAGGTGKSYISLYMALLIQYGQNIGRMVTKQCNVLYMDWESNTADLNDRLSALAKGIGIPNAEVYYRNSYLPLVEDINEIQRIVAENEIGFVVVDAKAASIGGMINEAKQTVEMFNALRSLGVTSLIIDHVSKESTQGPIGSVYNVNAARDVWELRASQAANANTSKIGLYHRKTNAGRRHDAFGLEFTFKDDENEIIDSVLISETDIAADPDTRKGLAMQDQITAVLRENIQYTMDGGHSYEPMTVDEIRIAIGSSNLDSVATRLSDRRFNSRSGRWQRTAPGKYAYLEAHVNGTGAF